MKKIALLTLAIVLLITIFVTAYARPVVKCPECDGEFRFIKVIKDWQTVRSGLQPHTVNGDFHYDGSSWQERTVACVCSNGTHASHIEKKNFVTECPVKNVGLWGWQR